MRTHQSYQASTDILLIRIVSKCQYKKFDESKVYLYIWINKYFMDMKGLSHFIHLCLVTVIYWYGQFKGWIGSIFITQHSSGSFSFDATGIKYLLNSFAISLWSVQRQLLIINGGQMRNFLLPLSSLIIAQVFLRSPLFWFILLW